ncbi:hypothetical protein SERLA73DRAFT_139706 [Serpula lacrymans var. lacrymans S7.3]|uniref:Crinkler effector protein N-terminal domain-containing protein n=2 Tax=Serpula lacrymans var. lacrymans TaxID=341189 RepID=F8Q2R1_SERL3|nr:uncharacterized protein SERLADRAFT_394026 [Serpula lacrymans var. lacrymans S7.9]EGN97472.1 hypothetical protein SERLA73DRAFT_139706 [Serpula lacrymans var. lacrymans S7.3]EGO23066.1 hypothetical protein SERLADRAFT_394026 [Serpula lacrymans var. lacrymans S7.9]
METLNCWIYGEDVESIFTVNISSSETVYNLKEAIKNKNSSQFRDVEAKYVDLYSICLSDDEQLEGTLSRWDHSEERKLNGWYKLSTLFSESKEGVWIIIVRAPSSCTHLSLYAITLLTANFMTVSSRGSVKILWWYGEAGCGGSLEMKSNRRASITSNIAFLWVARDVQTSCEQMLESESDRRLRRKPFVKR